MYVVLFCMRSILACGVSHPYRILMLLLLLLLSCPPPPPLGVLLLP
jgi:hypothetical protein